MPICYMNVLKMGELELPNLYQVGSYKIFFWSNENNEPVHVHITSGNPSANTTKIWLTSKGGCFAANNNSRIPSHDLRWLLRFVTANHEDICAEWVQFFGSNSLTFYC